MCNFENIHFKANLHTVVFYKKCVIIHLFLFFAGRTTAGKQTHPKIRPDSSSNIRKCDIPGSNDEDPWRDCHLGRSVLSDWGAVGHSAGLRGDPGRLRPLAGSGQSMVGEHICQQNQLA